MKAKASSKKTTLIILSFIILLVQIFIISCQPNPENEVIVNKDNFEDLVNNAPEKAIESKDNTDSSLTHIEWLFEDEKTTKTAIGDITLKTTISVNAMVDTSKKAASVYLVEPEEFNIDFVKNSIDYFFDGEYYGATRTKDDWLLKILPMENMLPNIHRKTSQTAEALLEIWKDRYNNAPDINHEADIVFDKGDYEILCLKGYPYKNAISELYYRNGGKSNTLFYYYVDDINKYYSETPFEYADTPAIGMLKSQQDSKQLATDAVKSIYGQEFKLVQTTLANKGNLDENWHPQGSTKLGKENVGTREQCYIYYFTRLYNGIPQIYAPEASNLDDRDSGEGGDEAYEQKWDYEYSMKWPAEYITVFVDDSGIVEFWGFSPTKIKEIVNENVDMLSFEKIFEKFKQSIYYTSIWADVYVEQLSIEINDIKFGMIRVPKKDNPELYYMVPAWQFIGDKYTYSSTDTDLESNETGKTFLVLNALDGSIVDTSYYENKRVETLKTIGEQELVNNIDVILP